MRLASRAAKSPRKAVACGKSRFPTRNEGDDLGLRVDGQERPHVAKGQQREGGVGRLFLHADEAPKLIDLDAAAGQPAHPGVQ